MTLRGAQIERNIWIAIFGMTLLKSNENNQNFRFQKFSSESNSRTPLANECTTQREIDYEVVETPKNKQ